MIESEAARRFASRLREFREARGWTYRELGRRSGCSGQYLAAVEKGQYRITLDRAAKVAASFGMELGEMILPCKSGQLKVYGSESWSETKRGGE